MTHSESFPLVSRDGLKLDAAIARPGNDPKLGVLLVHGITAEMNEGNMFADLASDLASAGFLSLRFSFRGHGRSEGTQEGVTIAGEMLDLLAAYDALRSQLGNQPLVVVASSFGAVSTSLLLRHLTPRPSALVYWNPVLDLDATFLRPTLPWGIDNFGSRIQAELESKGVVTVDGSFRLGPVIFDEMAVFDVRAGFVSSSMPALVIHGDHDTSVPFDLARQASSERDVTDFEAIEGADHGFDVGHEPEAIRLTLAWLQRNELG